MEKQQWKDAHVGVASKHITFRATEDERKRLEDLRKTFGLTSRGQVIRLALDMLETTTEASRIFASGGSPRSAFNHAFDGWDRMTASIVENTQDPDIAAAFRELLEDVEDASVDASSGLPAEAPPGSSNS